MDIELDPPRGITGFPIGMPAAEVKDAAAALGEITVRNEGSSRRFRSMTVLALHPQFEILFHLSDGKTLTASEVWIPRSGPEDFNVTYRGINVFTTPARQILDQIEAQGFSVHERDSDYPLVPHLSLGFTRVAGHEVPLDTDERPLFFQAVLVGPENYYDRLLERMRR